MVADIDDDGDVEIIVSKDTNSGSTFKPGHQSWNAMLQGGCGQDTATSACGRGPMQITASVLRLSASSQSGHRAVTQPLLADVDLDGAPDLVLP